MNQALVSLLIYLVLMFAVAWYFSRKESLESYLLNNKKTGLWLMTLSLVATIFGAGATVAIVSEVYNSGISYGIALPMSMLFAAILMAFFSKEIKRVGDRYETYTLVDFFYKRFDLKNKNLMLFVQLFVMMLWIATQAIAMASLASVLTNIDFNLALILSAGVTILYTAVGGLKIDFFTDFIQFWIIILVFVIMTVFGYFEVQGLSNLLLSLPEDHLNPFAFGGIVWFLGAMILGGFFPLGSSANWQRIMAAKNEDVARRAYIMAIPIIVFLSLVILFLGLSSTYLLGDINQDLALFSLMEFLLPGYLIGVGFAAILAIIMSSVDSLLIGGSTIIYREFFRTHKLSNRKKVLFARMITALFGIVGFLIAFLIPNIVTLSLLTTYLAITVAICVCFALYSKVSSNEMFWALLLASVSLFISFPTIGVNSFLVPLFISIFILILYDKVFNR